VRDSVHVVNDRQRILRVHRVAADIARLEDCPQQRFPCSLALLTAKKTGRC
jgi:hypothetical protein